jgi:hypothetical protein
VHVTAGQAAGPNASFVSFRQVASNVAACGVARFDGGHEAEPGPHQQRLHGRHRQAQHAPDVRVGHPAHLAHQQRGTLLIGEPADVDDQAT